MTIRKPCSAPICVFGIVWPSLAGVVPSDTSATLPLPRGVTPIRREKIVIDGSVLVTASRSISSSSTHIRFNPSVTSTNAVLSIAFRKGIIIPSPASEPKSSTPGACFMGPSLIGKKFSTKAPLFCTFVTSCLASANLSTSPRLNVRYMPLSIIYDHPNNNYGHENVSAPNPLYE